ncbi:MAG: hypothetical protein JXA96_17150 [Sedimentisphaerales bacterium]|nr:hypothetical protein [Sedimentisphaerales bacterium]
MKKPANATGLNSDRQIDRKAIDNLRELIKVVPGLSGLTGALRWLCEEEVPLIVDKYKRYGKSLRAP